MPAFNTVNGADYTLIGLYFAIVIYVGIYAARRNKGVEDFFKGGGKIPWVLAGLSNWVSGFSAFMFVAAAGYTYNTGVGAMAVFSMATWAYLAGYFYFAKMWRRARLDSPLQFLTRRYSPSTTYFYSVTAVIPQIVGIGQGLYILCIFVSTALGFGKETFAVGGLHLTGMHLSILVVGTVMVLYTVIGGLWAAVLSDAVQSIIIVVMTVIIFPVSYQYLGNGNGIVAGFERMLREIPPTHLRLQGTSANFWFMLAFLLNCMLGYNVAWHLGQRYYSVPDERGAQKMALLCAALSFFGPLLWILPVMASRVIFPDLGAIWPALKDPAESSYVSLALLLLPHGLIGFVVSAVLSATLGQANATFNWLAATTTRDIYLPLSRRLTGVVPSEKRQMLVAQLTMVGVGVLGIMVAFYIPRFGGAFQFSLQYYSSISAFMMPVALGMIYRRTPWWSGIASCCASLGAGAVLMAMDVWPENPFARNILGETVTATLVFALSARWYREGDPKNAEVERLDVDLRTPVLELSVAEPTGLGMYRVIGMISVVLGVVLIACSWLKTSPLAPASLNAVAGGLLVLLGVGLRRLVARGAPTLLS